MAKLFPPVIEGIVPAFYENENGDIVVTIPFSMNRAVSQSQVKGLAVKVKTVQSSSYIYTEKVEDSVDYELENSCWVRVYISPLQVTQMKKGQYYKFQIAYIDNDDDIGYYSTVGVGKYTTKPDIYIGDLEEGTINTHQYKYFGFYSQEKENSDKTEHVYSYQFDVYDENNNIVATSGEQLHNSSNDTEEDLSYDEFTYSKELPLNKSYRIKYTVTTINGLVISSPRYRIMQKISIDSDIQATLEATADFDNGEIILNLIGKKDDEGLEIPASGAFLLTRSCEDDNYTDWDEIARFKLSAQKPSRQLWKDYTVEQGKSYKYSIQQYNDKGLYSNRIYSNIVKSDFEDAFLFDGEKQLKIKYNPKIASFKTDLLETKVETIGSKHPFILRNGQVSYKEFSISGLISYLMDSTKDFDTSDELKSTQLTGENIAREREFKLKVYDWLTNGKSKLFRSPGEGNYIVRLMNVSLAPNDTLGRMLHTFTATAYEVADFSYSNLNSFGFISIDDPEVQLLRFETVNLGECYKDTSGSIIYPYGNNISISGIEGRGLKINSHPVQTIRFTDMNPGSKLLITLEGSNQTPQEIQIGITGSYNIDLGVPIKEIYFGENIIPSGQATYSFYSTQQNIFDKVDNISIIEVPTKQFIGEHDIIKEIEYVYDSLNDTWVRNPKIDLIKFYNLHVQKRSIEKIVKYGGKYYKDKDHTQELKNQDIFTLYALGEWKQKQQYNNTTDPSYKPYDRFNWEFIIKNYLDFSTSLTEPVKEEIYQPFILLDESQVSVEDTQDFKVRDFGKPNSLVIGNGCIVEASYQIREIAYSIENDVRYEVYGAKTIYLNNLEALKEYLEKGGEIDSINDSNVSETLENYQAELNILIKNVENSYINYILALVKAQAQQKEEERLNEE